MTKPVTPRSKRATWKKLKKAGNRITHYFDAVPVEEGKSCLPGAWWPGAFPGHDAEGAINLREKGATVQRCARPATVPCFSARWPAAAVRNAR